MNYYDTKIGKIIDTEFDSRMESAVFSYLMDKGIENIREITDEQIEKNGRQWIDDTAICSVIS